MAKLKKGIQTRPKGRTKHAARATAAARTGAKTGGRARRPFVIDFHAHVIVPEVMAFAKDHVVKGAPPDDPRIPEEARRAAREWTERNNRKTLDFQERLRDMNETGVDVQVLTPSLVHQPTYWADPEAGLKMEQLTNERVAEFVAIAPDRFVGLGGVPLQSPVLAVPELERCIKDLGLRGVQIPSTAGTLELGDPKLKPFWEAAEKLSAVVYIHPSGETSPRYARFQLWNSIGQPLEEAMAMASLFYEGVLDAYPKLKLCIAHGGGYLPFYAGRVDRNYAEKPFTRIHMSKSPSDYMRQHFWYDTCLYNQDMLEYLVRKVGRSRLVMGSDYPVGEADPVGFITTAPGLSAADKAAILGKNAAMLLGLSI
jgi:aminocarboxymuconate-semialdehyde decarboxylase